MARGLEPAGVEFIAENLDGYIRDLGKADKAQLGLGDSAEKSSGGLSVLGGVVTGVAMAVTTFAIDAVMKASQALVGFAADSIQVATDFESSMATLSIAASATGLSFDELSETALAVGGDTSLLGVSASGAAESMEGLFKAGLTTEEVFGDLQGYLAGTAELGGTLRASIDLAAATTLDMVAASDVAAIALATFGGEAEEAGISTDEWINEAMNNLVQAADASVAEVDGLVEALKMVGPAASAMGVTLAETNNALALLSTRGIQGSSAGTSLNRMMLDLVKGTSESAEMMEDLGISVYDSTGTFLPLVEIIGQFEIALGDATDAERDAAMAAIFTAQGARAMNTLLEEGVQGWVDMTDATADAATMQEQAAVKGETLAAQQEALEGVIETLQIKIGSALLPALTGLVQIFSSLVDEYGPLLASVFETIGQVASEVVEIIGELASGDIGLLDLIPDTSPIMNLLAAFEKVSAWFDDNGPAIESSLDQIGQVFGMVFESIKEVVEDIWPIFEEIGATFGETFEIVKEVLGELGLNFDDTGSGIETVTGIIIGVIEVMGGIIAGVLTAVAGTVKFFAEHFQGVWKGIRDVVQGVKEWFEGFKEFWTSLLEGDLPGAFEGLKKAFKGVWKTIRGTVKLIVKAITMPFAGLYKLIEGFVKGVIKFFKTLKKKLVGGSIIPDMMSKIEKVIETVLGAIEKVWNTVFKAIAELVKTVFATIERIIDRVMGTIEKIIDKVCKAIGGNWEDFIDLLLELWKDTWDDIRDFVDTVFNAIEKFIDTVSGDIQKAWETFTGAVQEVWEDVWGAIETFVDTTFNAIEKLIGTISGNIQKAWETFTETVQKVWEDIWGAIERFVDTTFSAIERLVGTISGNIQKAWETFTGAVQEAWETVWGAIETFVDTTFGNIETFIGTISGNIETAWDTFTGNVLSTWNGIWDDIDTKIRDIWGGIETFISTGIQNIVTFFTDATQDMIDAGAGIVDNIRQGIEDTWQSILDYISYGLTGESGSVISQIIGALATIKTRAEDIVDAIRDGVTDVWNRITSRITALLKGTGGYAGIMSAITAAWTAIENAGMQIINYIRDGLSDYFYRITTKLRDKLNDVDDGIIKGVTSAITAVTAAGAKIIDYIRTGLATAFYKVRNKLQDKLQGLKDSISDYTWGKINEIGGRLLAKIQAGVEAVTWWASNFWNWLWGQILDWLVRNDSQGRSAGAVAGTNIMDGMVDAVRGQAGRLTSALNYVTSQALGSSEPKDIHSPFRLDNLQRTGDWVGAAMVGSIEAGVMRAASGFSASLGLVAPAMMAPMAVSNSTEVNIGPVAINNGMDMAEFEVRVRQAVSEAI